jgi:YggT family protein
MPLVALFLNAVAGILDFLLWAYFWIVIIAAIITWVRPDPYSPVVRFLHAATEPVFFRIRRWLPFVMIGGFDLSPVVVLLIIQFLQNFLVPLLRSMPRTVVM